MPKSDFKPIHVSLFSSHLKNSFEMNFACLESIQVCLVNSCLIISFERNMNA